MYTYILYARLYMKHLQITSIYIYWLEIFIYVPTYYKFDVNNFLM